MKRFLSILAVGALALGLSTSASAQTRGIGGGSLVLDDGAGHTVTLLPPTGLTCSPTYYLPALGCGTSTIGTVPVGTAEGQLLYWNAGAWTTLGIGGNNTVLTSNGTDPSWQPGMSNPMTAIGDIIFGSTNTTPSTPSRLGGNIAATKKFLSGTGTGAAATAPTWAALVSSDIPNNAANTTGTASNVTGTVAIANGGTGQTTQQTAINALAGGVTTAQYLRGNGTNVVLSGIQVTDVPTLNQNTTGTAANVTGVVAVANGGTGNTSIAAHAVVIGEGATAFASAGPGALNTVLHGNGAADPSFSSVSLIADVSNTLPIGNGGTGQTTQQTAINALAGGVTTAQYLRGNGTNVVLSGIQVTDVPTLNQNTTGTAANVTGTVAIANGGTGQTTQQTAINALAGGVTAAEYLRGDGTNVSLSGIQVSDVPTLNQNTTGTAANVTGTVAIANGGTGQTTQQTAINALAGGVTNAQYLRGNGTNVVLSGIQVTDVPTLNQNTTGTAANVTGTVATGNGGTGVTGTASNGQLLIGNGAGYTLANITAGSNISVTNGAGSITIATTGGSSGNGEIVGGISHGTSLAANAWHPATVAAVNAATGAIGSGNVMIATRAGTIKNLFAGVGATSGNNGHYWVFTIHDVTSNTDGPSASGVGGATAIGSDVATTLSVAAGDIITMVVTSHNATATTDATWTFEMQ